MPRDPGGIEILGIGILYHGSKLLSSGIAFFFLTQKLLSGILSPVLGYCLSPITVRSVAVKKLFVGNLPYGANETDVQNFFADAGVNVDSVTVMRDRFTGQARGFGFVEINDDDAAQRAVDGCHGKELMGRTLVVNEARPRAPREGGGGRPPRH
jgi:hypothetical protein